MLQEFLYERRKKENEILMLKRKLENGEDAVLKNFRPYTEEEIKIQEQLRQAEEELRNLMYFQIKQVIESGSDRLKEEYFESIPDKYNDMRMLLSLNTRLSDGTRMEIITPCINAEYLTNPDSNLASNNFDNAIALLGADGVKMGYLDEMLKILGSTFINSKASELSPVEIHILNLISSFSSPEVAVGLFNGIYKSPETNSIEHKNLCMNFANSIEQNQAIRRQMDSDLIHHTDFKLFKNEEYFIINFSYTNMFGSLPEEEKQQIMDSSKENALRIRKSEELPPIDQDSIMNKIYYRNSKLQKSSEIAEGSRNEEQEILIPNDETISTVGNERILSVEEIEAALEVLKILGQPITAELEAVIQSYIMRTQNPAGRGY